jgi:16S rRNA (guanine527-N7)-methyltransferase
MRDYLFGICRLHGFELGDEILDRFEVFFERLLSYNEKVNLTAITEPRDAALKHFLDSIVAAPLLEKNCEVCDIGAGGGFPSVPLKIVRDDLRFTLYEALNKRVKFLCEASEMLRFKNFDIFHARAENTKKKFDVVVARAVGSLDTLCKYSLPLLRKNGRLIAYKGGEPEKEIEEAKDTMKKLGGEVTDIVRYNLADTDIKRTLVIVSKCFT